MKTNGSIFTFRPSTTPRWMTTFSPSSTSGAIIGPLTKAARLTRAGVPPCSDARERPGRGQWTHPECERGAPTLEASVSRGVWASSRVSSLQALGRVRRATPIWVAAIVRRLGPVLEQAAKCFRKRLPGRAALDQQLEHTQLFGALHVAWLERIGEEDHGQLAGRRATAYPLERVRLFEIAQGVQHKDVGSRLKEPLLSRPPVVDHLHIPTNRFQGLPVQVCESCVPKGQKHPAGGRIRTGLAGAAAFSRVVVAHL